MEVKLDEKYKRILRILTEDARASTRSIAKQIRTSREVVNYRIKRLNELGVIKNYIVKADMTQFYHDGYAMFIRLSQIDPIKFNKMIDMLAKNPFTMWVATLSGEWDVALSFLTRNTSDLHNVIRSVEVSLGDSLREYGLLTYVKEVKNTFEDLFPCDDDKRSDFMIKGFPHEKVDIDKTDKKILCILSENANVNNIEMSRRVGLTAEAVRQRIKSLKRKGIIRGFRTIIDIYKLNLEIYYVLMKFSKLSREKEMELETFFRNHHNVYYCARTVGRYDIIACITAKDRIHFHKIITDIRNRFSKTLTNFSTNTIFEEHKHTYLPRACLES
jgi:DNA-binding Lrp family transcriptional regulator